MAWVESHQSLERHPKTLGLMAIMGWSLRETIGTLHIFWWWCIDYAPDGDLRKHSNAVLAVAAGLSPAAGDQFIKAMVECRGKDETGSQRPGFIEKQPYFRLRNWWKRVGRFLQARYKSDPAFLEKVRSAYGASRNLVASNSQQTESPLPQTPISSQDQAVTNPNQPKPTRDISPVSSLNDKEETPPFEPAKTKKPTKGKKTPVAYWAELIDFIKKRWELKKPSGVWEFSGQDAALLNAKARLYGVPKLMALYVIYLRTPDPWYIKHGYDIPTFCEALGWLVDQPGWKEAAAKYDLQLNSPKTAEEKANVEKVGQVLSSMMNGKITENRKAVGELRS